MSLTILDHAENHVFTNSYSQPEAYHFCQDSVILPMFVAKFLSSRSVSADERCLDVCAGCGVVGLELAHYEPRIRHFDFLEIQNEFAPHFTSNLARVNRPEFRWLERSYDDLKLPEFRGLYRLIVGNPPYFFRGEGRLSSSELQNRCRFFLDSNFSSLLSGVASALAPGGDAFLLTKSGDEHGRTLLRETRLLLQGSVEVSVAAEIRGTLVLHLHRPLS